MGVTVYRERRDGTLEPVGHTDRHAGQAAILAVLVDHGIARPSGYEKFTRYVAYDDADGTDLEVR